MNKWINSPLSVIMLSIFFFFLIFVVWLSGDERPFCSGFTTKLLAISILFLKKKIKSCALGLFFVLIGSCLWKEPYLINVSDHLYDRLEFVCASQDNEGEIKCDQRVDSCLVWGSVMCMYTTFTCVINYVYGVVRLLLLTCLFKPPTWFTSSEMELQSRYGWSLMPHVHTRRNSGFDSKKKKNHFSTFSLLIRATQCRYLTAIRSLLCLYPRWTEGLSVHTPVSSQSKNTC